LFSVIAFQNGNMPIGVLFALAAASPIAFFVSVTLRGRREALAQPQPLGKGRTLVMRLIAVAAVAMIGYGVYWVLFAPKASSQAPVRMSDLEAGCSSPGKYFPQNDAYTGTGPHPIGVFLTDDADFTNLASMGTDVPAHWDDLRMDPRHVQVIACLDKPDDGDYLTDCTFTSSTLKLYQGVYDVTLYEASTGKEIGTERIAGSGEPSCPYMAFTKRSAASIHTEPEPADYRVTLGKYVDN
jgi:hypothetical protein